MRHDNPVHMMLGMVRMLDELNIRYLVTGGMAVVVWGRPRFTADVDFVIELSKDSLPHLQKALERFCEKGLGTIDPFMMEQALRETGEFNYIDADSDVKVDFWVAGKTTFEKQRFDRRIRREVLGYPLWIISPEDLLLMKLKWIKGGSYRSIDDVRSIIACQQDALDWVYIKSWVQKLNFLKELEMAMAREEPS